MDSTPRQHERLVDMKFILSVLLTLVVLPFWISGVSAVQSVDITGTGNNRIVTIQYDTTHSVVIDLENNVRSILSGAERNDPVVVAARASDYLQMLIDENVPGGSLSGRHLLTEYDADDPARLADPGVGNFFWARQDGFIGSGPSRKAVYRPTALIGGTATHIISRPFLATFVVTGNTYNIAIQSQGFPLR